MKTARKPQRIRIVDRGDWAIVRLPAALLTQPQRRQIAEYIGKLPLCDRQFAGTIEAWCIKTDWLEPVTQLIESVTSTTIAVES